MNWHIISLVLSLCSKNSHYLPSIRVINVLNTKSFCKCAINTLLLFSVLSFKRNYRSYNANILLLISIIFFSFLSVELLYGFLGTTQDIFNWVNLLIFPCNIIIFRKNSNFSEWSTMMLANILIMLISVHITYWRSFSLRTQCVWVIIL